MSQQFCLWQNHSERPNTSKCCPHSRSSHVNQIHSKSIVKMPYLKRINQGWWDHFTITQICFNHHEARWGKVGCLLRQARFTSRRGVVDEHDIVCWIYTIWCCHLHYVILTLIYIYILPSIPIILCLSSSSSWVISITINYRPST